MRIFGFLLLLFTLVPLIELFLLIKIGGIVGAGNTILIVVVTGIIGAWLAKNQGLAVAGQLQARVNRGEVPGRQLLDGVFVLMGGLLLLTPGIVTDALGLSLLLPPTRAVYRALALRLIRQRFSHMVGRGFNDFKGQWQGQRRWNPDDDIFDNEDDDGSDDRDTPRLH